MSLAEKFIIEHTRNCSNIEYTQGAHTPSYHPWLTPDQARKAVEIAKEEIYEWLEKNQVGWILTEDDIEQLKQVVNG